MDLAILPAQEFSHRHFLNPLPQLQCHDADFPPPSPKKTFPKGMSKLTGGSVRLYDRESLCHTIYYPSLRKPESTRTEQYFYFRNVKIKELLKVKGLAITTNVQKPCEMGWKM